MAADDQQGRRQGQRRHHCDKDADSGGNAQALEVREPGEGQTEHRAGNRQARTQDDVRGSVVHRVERRDAILPGVTRFVKAAENEDRIVGSGGDDQQRQQIGRIRRQLDDAGVREHSDDAAGRGQLDHHRENHQKHRGETTVEREQHQCDHPEGDQGGLQGAVAAHLELIGDQGRGAGDIGLDARRRRRVIDDVRAPNRRTHWPTTRPGCRRGTPAPMPPCRRSSASRPPSADRPRNSECARRAWCPGRASRSSRRSSGARRHRAADRPPGRSSPNCRNRTRRTPCRYVYWPATTANPGGSATRCAIRRRSPTAARRRSSAPPGPARTAR